MSNDTKPATAADAPAKKQRPQYQVMEKSYLPDDRLGVSRIFDPEEMPFQPENEDDPDAPRLRKPLLTFYDGKPGHNLRPHNDEAKRVWLEHWGRPYDECRFPDPIRDLCVVSPVGAAATARLRDQ